MHDNSMGSWSIRGKLATRLRSEDRQFRRVHSSHVDVVPGGLDIESVHWRSLAVCDTDGPWILSQRSEWSREMDGPKLYQCLWIYFFILLEQWKSPETYPKVRYPSSNDCCQYNPK